MKTLRMLPVLVLAVLLPALAFAAAPGSTKSPQHYHFMTYTFSTATSISGGTVGVLPQQDMVLRDVIVAQNAVGSVGTSWVATPKRAGVALVSTAGGWTLAAGAGLVTNALQSPLKVFTAPTGATRPVIQRNVAATGTVQASTSVTAGDTVTIGGVVFTAAITGNGVTTYTVSANATTQATNLKNVINANTSVPVTATSTGDTITITARRSGAAGNAITLAESAHWTVSGAVLTGGFDAASTGGSLITMDITLTGSYSNPVTGAVVLVFEPAQ